MKKQTNTQETLEQMASLQRQLLELQAQVQRAEEDRFISSISVNITGRNKKGERTVKTKARVKKVVKTMTTTEKEDTDDSSLNVRSRKSSMTTVLQAYQKGVNKETDESSLSTASSIRGKFLSYNLNDIKEYSHTLNVAILSI